MTKNQDLRTFRDKDKNGKDRKWKERKLANIDLAKSLERLGYRNFNNVYECAEVLRFREQENGSLKLYQAWFCKKKLCPICNWRRSMKYSYQAEQVIEEAIKRHEKGRFLFLTLTVKNVNGDFINQEIGKISEGFRRLMLYKKVDKNVIGYLRALEVTYSTSRDDYHPHLHVLLFVSSSYFKNSDNYISQDEWTKLWKKAMKLDYTPVVNIKAVKSTEKYDLKGAVLETAKYPVKPFDLLNDDFSEETKDTITDDLTKGLHRKRQIGFGKLFKEIRKELQLEDIEEGDLVTVQEENDDEKNPTKEIVARWNWERKNYFVPNE